MERDEEWMTVRKLSLTKDDKDDAWKKLFKLYREQFSSG